MNDGKLQSNAVKTNLKEVEDKLAQLIREVTKLQEQVAVISSQGNGTYNTTNMQAPLIITNVNEGRVGPNPANLIRDRVFLEDIVKLRQAVI